MTAENGVNIFNTYKEENSFTNGLFSLLKLSVYEKPGLVASFLKLLDIERHAKVFDCSFGVLRGIDFADAELRSGDCCLRFETKIKSGSLSRQQVRRRLNELRRCPGRLKRVVLLTPDDSNSSYIGGFGSKHVRHLGWIKVYRFLEEFANAKDGTFSELATQFLYRIRSQVFQLDFAGVITKIAFGDHSQVYPDEYLGEFRRREWDCWNTPRVYKELDGTGRKLLLYDREQQGITAEVEIEKVEHVPWERNFPSRNVFASDPKIFKTPILLDHIRSILGFENFGKYRKDRSPYRNVTREQYRQLVG
jgi:hypothetical protein